MMILYAAGKLKRNTSETSAVSSKTSKIQPPTRTQQADALGVSFSPEAQQLYQQLADQYNRIVNNGCFGSLAQIEEKMDRCKCFLEQWMEALCNKDFVALLQNKAKYDEYLKGFRLPQFGTWRTIQTEGSDDSIPDGLTKALMGTYNGRSSSAMAPDAPISRQEAMTVVARALELDYDSYSKTDLSAFSDRSEISNWALPYVRAMVGADYIHGRGKILAPLDNITRAEFAQIFHNIIGTYVVSKGTYDKDIKGSVLICTDDVELKNLTVDGDLIIGCGAADGKIVLDNVTVKGRLLVWGGGTKAVYCNAGTNMPAVVVARVDDAVKVIYDRDSTLAVIDTIKVRITERAKAFKETEVVFYDVSGLREAQKQLNAIVADNQIDITAPAHLYALVGESSVKAEFVNNSKSDTYKVEIRKNKDNALIADAFELAAGKSISTLTLLEAPEFGNVDCTVTITAFRDGKQIGTLNTELTLHTAYLWPKEVQ